MRVLGFRVLWGNYTGIQAQKENYRGGQAFAEWPFWEQSF